MPYMCINNKSCYLMVFISQIFAMRLRGIQVIVLFLAIISLWLNTSVSYFVCAHDGKRYSVEIYLELLLWTQIWLLPLRWRHNGRDSVSNHQPHDCLLNVYSDADQRKHQSSASLAFVLGIHRCFHLIMLSWRCPGVQQQVINVTIGFCIP